VRVRGTSQEDLEREVRERIEGAVDTAVKALGGLSEEQLAWKPGPDIWSVAECLDHLVTTHDAYWPGIVEATPSTAPLAPAGNCVRSTFAARMLRRAVDPDSRSRHRAPAVFEPGRSQVPGDPLDAFQRAFAELRTRIEGTRAMDWHRIRVASPAARLIRLRLGDVYWILAAHGQRHVNQAVRVTQSGEFPTA
jgi:hypothetical protein